MRLISKEAVGYAVLLVILFAIAALAVLHTLDFLQKNLQDPTVFHIAALLIWSVTLGFMLIAGAFGLWAVQFAALAEGRRRVGRLVDAMDYLQDGLVAVDVKGRISGANPAARALAAARTLKGEPLRSIFGELTDADLAALLTSREPAEVERRHLRGDDARTLRFRSQPSEGLSLILISDVTAMDAQRQHNRQVARLQLIGQIARGVAHDFNNLLCAISGHASLLARLPPASPDIGNSLRAIAQSVERGSALAGHLLQLARAESSGETARAPLESLRIAVADLTNSLPPAWQIELSAAELPLLTLAGLQLEQVVLNLGLLAADTAPQPGRLRVAAARLPAAASATRLDSRPAAVIHIGPDPLAQRAAELDARFEEIPSDAGLILSVVKTVVEGAGGQLQQTGAPDGSMVFRLALPLAPVSSRPAETAGIPPQLLSYVGHWTVLLGRSAGHRNAIAEALRLASVRTVQADSMTALLARLQETPRLDAVVVERRLLGDDPAAVLAAVLRLQPSAAYVVIGADEQALGPRAADVVTLPDAPSPDRVLMAMLEARNLAARRKT